MVPNDHEHNYVLIPHFIAKQDVWAPAVLAQAPETLAVIISASILSWHQASSQRGGERGLKTPH